jgi:MSHA biogenesis protein MshG
MLGFSRLPLTDLITLSRALRHGHTAGLSLVRVFRQQGTRGSARLRPLAERIADRLERGDSLANGLKPDAAAFPPLFLDLCAVGEKTGRLPEVFHELERYFDLQLSLRRQFLTAIAWPAFELVGAFVVVTLLMMILPIITPGYDPLGFGVGLFGIVRFWMAIAAFFALLVAGYFVVTRVLGQAERVHKIVLRIPALGPTLESLALLRFCMAMHATWEAGLKVKAALRTSLRATSNPAFMAQESKIAAGVKRGEDLVTILSRCSVFPPEFLNVVATGEESGRLPEVLAQQVQVYREETERRLRNLTRAAAWTVYALIGLFIIFLMYRLLMGSMGPGTEYHDTKQWLKKEGWL